MGVSAGWKGGGGNVSRVGVRVGERVLGGRREGCDWVQGGKDGVGMSAGSEMDPETTKNNFIHLNNLY